MKKLALTITAVLFFSGNAFCRTRQLTPIPTKHITVEEHNGKQIQSVTVNDVRITLIAKEKKGNNIEFTVTLTNLDENKSYLFDEKSITVKRGNHYKKEWRPVYFDYPSEYYKSKKDEQIAAEVGTAVAATVATVATVATIASIVDGFSHPAPKAPPVHSGSHSPGLKAPPRKLKEPPRSSGLKAPPVHRASPPPRMYRPSAGRVAFGLLETYLVLDAIDDYEKSYNDTLNDLEYLEDNLLFSQKIEPNSTYYGVFFIPENKGPEYKITFRIPERNGEPEKKVNFYVEK